MSGRSEVCSLVRPPDNVYFQELQGRYRYIRRFLPTLLNHLRFGASPAGEPVVAAFNWLWANGTRHTPGNDAPREAISKSWQPYVLRDSDEIDMRAYTFCVLDELHTALRRREVFVTPSWRDADPRAGLLTGTEWDAARPIICRTLGLSPDPPRRPPDQHPLPYRQRHLNPQDPPERPAGHPLERTRSPSLLPFASSPIPAALLLP